MYPDPLFLGLTLYDILLCLGVVLCFVLFSVLADRHRVKGRIQKFALLCGIFAVVLGYCSAVLFQALYNIKTIGGFEINATTGATFYGGLIGGVAIFCLLYFAIGRLKFGNTDHFFSFFSIADSAVPGIALAHSLGRLGCLSAGCCHGAITDKWYGIMMYGDSGYACYVPVQLFEAIFLFLLFGFLLLRSVGRKGYVLPLYLCMYGVWRFLAEFIRADYRGDTFIDSLTPSQLIACILVVVGIGVIFIERRLKGICELRNAKIDPTMNGNPPASDMDPSDDTSDKG